MIWKYLMFYLAGAAMGIFIVIHEARTGLTKEEWQYLQAFHDALKNGRYETIRESEDEEAE